MFFSFSYDPSIAVLGDIKNSRNIKNRGAVQKKLNGVLEEVNERYAEDLSSKFVIKLGDEFQGLLCRGANKLQIIFEIERRMYPVKIRFGIGVGRITTDVIKEMSIGADGPGYYLSLIHILCVHGRIGQLYGHGHIDEQVFRFVRAENLFYQQRRFQRHQRNDGAIQKGAGIYRHKACSKQYEEQSGSTG